MARPSNHACNRGLVTSLPLGYAKTHPCPEILCRSSPFAIASYSRPRPRSPMYIADLGALYVTFPRAISLLKSEMAGDSLQGLRSRRWGQMLRAKSGAKVIGFVLDIIGSGPINGGYSDYRTVTCTSHAGPFFWPCKGAGGGGYCVWVCVGVVWSSGLRLEV